MKSERNPSKLSSQKNPEALVDLHQITDAEGRKVITHFAQSLEEFEELYKDLAK